MKTSGSDLTAESNAIATEEVFQKIWNKQKTRGRNRKEASEESKSSRHRSEGSLDISGVIFGDQVEKKIAVKPKEREKSPNDLQKNSYRAQLLQAK